MVTVRPPLRIAFFALSALVVARQPVGADNVPRPAAAPMIDRSTTKLPPFFAGDSFEAKVKLLAVPERDKFESAAEYQRRREQAAGRTLSVATVTALENSELSYNADARSLLIDLKARFIPMPNDIVRMRAESVGVTSSYIATNAFGARVKVKKSRDRNYFVAFVGKPVPQVLIHATPAVARELYSTLELLTVFDLKPQEVAEEYTDNANPTFEQPFDSLTTNYILNGNLVVLCLFNRETGEILARYDNDGRALP